MKPNPVGWFEIYALCRRCAEERDFEECEQNDLDQH